MLSAKAGIKIVKKSIKNLQNDITLKIIFQFLQL